MDACWNEISAMMILFLNLQGICEHTTRCKFVLLSSSFRQFALEHITDMFPTKEALQLARHELCFGSSHVQPIPFSHSSLEWVQLCRTKAEALDRKRKATESLKEIDVEALLAKGLSQAEIATLSERRQDAFLRRLWLQLYETSMPPCLNQQFVSDSGSLGRGIRLPLPEAGWTPVDLSYMPCGFMTSGKADVEFNLLKDKNPHPRDQQLRFEEETHTYFIDGCKIDISVTGVIGAYQPPFEPDTVICRMQQGQWPRPEYIQLAHKEKALLFASQHLALRPLVPLLQAQQPDKIALAQLLQEPSEDGAVEAARCLLIMTVDEIKNSWKRNGEIASKLGTWAHLQCECVLNGGHVATPGPEMRCLASFLQNSDRLLAFRTEWAIWATEEKLAGTIDFCTVDYRGCMVLVDWKRSKNLETKYFAAQGSMLHELSRYPSCPGWKYRLQLNIYKYIVEQYYGFRVSRMLVVSIHPDCVDKPFLDDVPDMQAEVRTILSKRREQVRNKRHMDILGGADSLMSQGSLVEEDDEGLALAEAFHQEENSLRTVKEEGGEKTNPVTAASQLTDACKKEDEEEVAEELEVAGAGDEVVQKIKRRRLLKGAFTSAADFEDLWQGYQDIVKAKLTHVQSDCASSDYCMLKKCQNLRSSIRRQQPTWSDDMVRLASTAAAVSNLRLSAKLFVGDAAFLLWLVEGEATIRVHSGFCYIYNDDGAFLPYSGIPPESVLARVSLFCTILEGAFKRFPPGLQLGFTIVARSFDSLLFSFPYLAYVRCYVTIVGFALVTLRADLD